MVLCKFYLQGTCRFGNACKFEHGRPQDNYGNTTSILLQQKPNTDHSYHQPSNVETSTLVKSVVNDMVSLEKSGQWLLSTYAPFKEKPNYPGFENHSMEEVRYTFYEAVKNGNLEQFSRDLQLMQQQAVMSTKALQNPSPDAVNILKQIYNTPVQSGQTEINQSQSMFGFAQNPMGAPQSSIFGTKPMENTSSIFSTSPTNQPLEPTNSIFGGGNSMFAQAEPSKSIFGGQNSIFVSQPQQSFFNSGGVQPTSGAIFSSPLMQQQPQPTIQPQQSIFGRQEPAQILDFTTFQKPLQEPTPALMQPVKPPQSTNIFGNASTAAPPGIFGGNMPPKYNEDFYSKLEELSESDIKWYETDEVDMSTIPEKPPTYEMCFKT